MSELAGILVETRMEDGSGVMMRWDQRGSLTQTHRCEKDRSESGRAASVSSPPRLFVVVIH